jgi:calcineurin-like phosphoesterase family protein
VPVFFTSDQHFGDHRRLFIDRRPFASVEEMDRAMAERWNAAVGPGDTVWHLGDLTRLRNAERIDALLSSLNGEKHLVVGNNDARPRSPGRAGRASAITPKWRSMAASSSSVTMPFAPGTAWAAAG